MCLSNSVLHKADPDPEEAGYYPAFRNNAFDQKATVTAASSQECKWRRGPLIKL